MARLCLFFIAAFLVAQGQSKSIFDPLAKFIRSKTKPLEIPLDKPGSPLNVDFQMGILDIEDVDRKHNKITAVFWVSYLWNSNIKWDPKDYNNIRTMSFLKQIGYAPEFESNEFAGELEFTTPYSLSYMFTGLSGVFYRAKTTMQCEDVKKGSCSIMMMSYEPNNIIKMTDKSKHLFDLNKMMKKDRYEGSKYKLVSESFKIDSQKWEGLPSGFDYLDYTFEFERRSHDEGPFAVFKWH